MICNYCSALFDESRPHYCIAGRDFLMSEIKRLRAIIREFRAQHDLDRTADACEARKCKCGLCKRADKEVPR